MSKKKAFSGNTMTLKDFHGGSIPTDLPLPSAPGVIVRPSDRSGYDRGTSWGNPMGRPDHRARPNSSPATRHFDNKTPFLTNSVHIGRNFDEDERTPLDGVSAPRRTISDESFRAPARHLELKPESAYAGRVSGRHGSAPVSPLSSGRGHSHSGRVSEAARGGLSSQTLGWNHGQAASGPYPNAWTSRKEMSFSVAEPVQSAWSEQSAVSKLAHASALEKVSSGRWQSKQSLQYQKDIDVSKHSEVENGLHSQGYDDKMYSRMSLAGGREYSDVSLARHVEKGLNIEDGIHGGRKELPEYERNRNLNYLEVKENKSMLHSEAVRSTHSDGKFGGYELQSSPSALAEASERPKLKLFPRSKRLDGPKSPVVDPKQGHQQPSELMLTHTEIGNHSHEHLHTSKPGLAGSESRNQTVDRPKLNLKRRSQPIEQLEGNIEKERNSLFGGARPRELVLKERGIDDRNHEPVQHVDRVKHNVTRTEKAADQASPRHGERVENPPVDQRGGRKSERNHRVDNGRVDMQRSNWRNENRRNGWETERPQQAPPVKERQPSPETWRKPVVKTNPVSAQVAGVRYGKVTSALELAQAFSKSFSDQKKDDQYGGQRGTPGRTQMPFSRLMGPTPRPQINGY
ncbi:hypothetical protein ERO13_D09G070300v2 [Gossypium hirsutum]|uniref:Uncharacterized protein isoform X2 n=2 Tax=Gossypium TaxID=3633 RepID=A0A1U8I7L0_GOSHI|nr:uncharacterized protein LOC107891799 isoform X2 [Gossypium hirsutum]KAG4129282.1 hypothetical protein ERO13_D09G070300v2 [Gossypium hirsutum]TYI64402.1 hypothetical protein E1A91_D09G085800v1 [Gossypium mustelinum]